MVTKEIWYGRFIDAELTAKYFEICSQIHHGEGEKHHILPRSMWPEYEFCKWNLVNLSYADHYKVHEMLAKMCISKIDSEKMIKSWWIITNRFRGEYIDAEKYAELKSMARKSISEHMMGNKNGLGSKHSEESKKKLSEAKLGDKNPMYGIAPKDHPMFGKTHTEESRKKFSAVHTGNKHRLGYKSSEETKSKISAAKKGQRPWLGKKHREDSKLKMSKNLTKWIYIKCDEEYNAIKEYDSGAALRLDGYVLNNVYSAARLKHNYAGFKWLRRPKEDDETTD